MKFSCGECQAKYQIPDERVAGRKLKIRCRKCGAAISLRGDPTVEGIAGLAPAKPAVGVIASEPIDATARTSVSEESAVFQSP